VIEKQSLMYQNEPVVIMMTNLVAGPKIGILDG
jgi:hypothetical protein